MVDRDEFEAWMHLLRGDIRGVHERLDGLNGRTRSVETKVAILEDRGDKSRDPAARWGALGAGVSALISAIWQMVGK